MGGCDSVWSLICLAFLGSDVNGLTNLAFKKTAIGSPQSDSQHDTSKAMDGIIGGDGSSCFQTSRARNGWLSVDLERKVRIQRVVVHGRVDCCADRLNNMAIKVSLNDLHSNDKLEVCNSHGAVSDGEKINFICQNQFKEYRYVTIAGLEKPHFYVCEVEVYERELDSFGCFGELDIIHNETDANLEMCLLKCNNLKTTFAALKQKNVCICSDKVSRRKYSKICSVQCQGSSKHFCGGSNAFSVYTVCSPGYYGNHCDEVCHCKDRTPCNRNGKCFDVCQPGWTGDKCDKMEDDNLFQLVGCFERKSSMEFSGIYNEINCAKKCIKYDFKYFGSKDNYYCYCFEEKEHLQLRNCDYYALKLFDVCKPGSFGDFCLDTCHCLNGGCWKDNGTCQIEGCQDGWKGPSCSIRDCIVNNGGCGEHSKCQEDDGGQFCFCHEGGYNELRSCEDVDECSLGISKCGNNSECLNIPGSYKCDCSIGYKTNLKDALSCEDVDECKFGFCDATSTDCHNNIGSFKCTCKDGFHSEDERASIRSITRCQDIDECSTNNGGCDLLTTNCSNTIGSFECICKDDHHVLNTRFKFCQEDLSATEGSTKAGLNQTTILVIVASVALLVLIILAFAFIYFKVTRKIRKIQADSSTPNAPAESKLPGHDRLSSVYDEINPDEELAVFKPVDGYTALSESTKFDGSKLYTGPINSNTYSVLQSIPAPRVSQTREDTRETYLQLVDDGGYTPLSRSNS